MLIGLTNHPARGRRPSSAGRNWWRVINKFIPARKILHDRHMEQISFCETCGAQQESIYHAMFECTWAKLFWAELRLLTDVKIPEFHPSTWAMDMIDSKLISESKTCMILCGSWAAWQERNARKHGDGGRSVKDSVQWVMQTTLDLSQLGRDKLVKVPKRKEKWKLPDEGIIKINTDASFFSSAMNGGTGFIARGNMGSMIRAQALWHDHAASEMCMEAMAICEGVRHAMERDIHM